MYSLRGGNTYIIYMYIEKASGKIRRPFHIDCKQSLYLFFCYRTVGLVLREDYDTVPVVYVVNL